MKGPNLCFASEATELMPNNTQNWPTDDAESVLLANGERAEKKII